MIALKQTKCIDDIWPVFNKKMIIRADFNVPIKDGKILNDFRIRSAIPTIRRVIDQGGKVILLSHLGRPKGKNISKLELEERIIRRELKKWAVDSGTGKTTHFALLTGAEKKQILSWSTLKEKAAFLSENEDSGKTELFSSLDDVEKKDLLDKMAADFTPEKRAQMYQGYVDELSLRPVAKRLEKILNEQEKNEPASAVTRVIFAEDCLDAQAHVDQLQPGQVLLLENVRFYSNENSKDESERLIMAEKIALYGDYFVLDAFGTAHRNSATVTGIPKVIGHGVSGYLVKQEMKAFINVLVDPPRPLVAIVGGSKVSDKILLLESMLSQIDVLIIGGAMAYTFLNAQGFSIGNSFHQAGQTFIDSSGKKREIDKLAWSLLEKAKQRNIKVALPIDHICHTEFKSVKNPFITTDENIPDGYMALDIGPKTVQYYCGIIEDCRAAIWNGPMGVFEIATYATGTYSIARALAEGTEKRGMLSIIGGGDSASAAEQSGYAGRMSHVSTGGGASLELLEGKILPGIAALDKMDRS